jgi:hypothetical protein
MAPDEPAASAAADTAPAAAPETASPPADGLLKQAQDDLALARAELQALKDAELSEIDRLKKQAAAAESRASALEQESLRRRIAQEENLPQEALGFLTGEGEAALRAGAQALVSLIGARPAAAGSRTQPASGQAPGLDEQIAAAEQSGNRALSFQLKTQKMRAGS